MKFLIIGAGSIGKRHARNLVTLGHAVGCVDTRADRREQFGQMFEPMRTYPSLEMALEMRWNGAVVSTPPADHAVPGHMLLDAGIPHYMEKNLTLDVESARNLVTHQKSSGVPVVMGYSWRFEDSLYRFMERVTALPWLRCEMVMAQHLSEWHPHERYQDFYVASRGGIQNEAHWLDQMLLWCGHPPILKYANLDKVSTLEITTKDVCHVICDVGHDREVDIRMNLYQRPAQRSITFHTEEETIRWDPIWSARNDMFMDAMAHLSEVCKGQVTPACTLEDGLKVVELIDQIETMALAS